MTNISHVGFEDQSETTSTIFPNPKNAGQVHLSLKLENLSLFNYPPIVCVSFAVYKVHETRNLTKCMPNDKSIGILLSHWRRNKTRDKYSWMLSKVRYIFQKFAKEVNVEQINDAESKESKMRTNNKTKNCIDQAVKNLYLGIWFF